MNLKIIIIAMNAITCVGDKFILLGYSSLNRINPPNPEGMLIPVSAIIFYIQIVFKSFLIEIDYGKQ